MNGKCIPALATLLSLALVSAAPAAAQDDATELPPVTVTAPVPPLDRPLVLLRLLVEQSAPCLGCDAVLAAAQPPAARLLGYLLASQPPPPAAGELLLLDLKIKDSPDLEFLRP